MDLRQLIFDLLKTQILFGVHRYGESLPTIKEASGYFLASVDTVRHAYVRLRQEGYISLSTCVGATVIVRYSDEEIQEHIRSYFSCRRDSMLAFARSVGVLSNHSLWFALDNATPKILDELERSCMQKEILPVYRMSHQLQLIFSPLGNDLLLRLFWKMFLYFQAPLVSVPHNIKQINNTNRPLLDMIQSVREHNGRALRDAVEFTGSKYFAGLSSFLEKNHDQTTDQNQIAFSWSIYKKTSQACYTLCMELLIGIRDGLYPVGSFLPSPKELAQEKQVGIKTIRRTLSLLNKLGSTISVNGIGTKVLPPWDCHKNCDFTDAIIQKRLLDFLQSFHILTLSCRTCAEITIDSMDADTLCRWTEQLEKVKRVGKYEELIFVCFENISLHAPYQAIQTVYTELVRQLFWGFPLRPHGEREDTNAYFFPYLEAMIDCLRRADGAGFSKSLEHMQILEIKYIVMHYLHLGIQEADLLLIPDLVLE